MCLALPFMGEGVAIAGIGIGVAGAIIGFDRIFNSSFPPGFMPGDKGAEEWGRRNDIGAKDGRRRFHEIKRKQRGKPGLKAEDNCGVNPETGDIIDGQGQDIGNLHEDGGG